MKGEVRPLTDEEKLTWTRAGALKRATHAATPQTTANERDHRKIAVLDAGGCTENGRFVMNPGMALSAVLQVSPL